MKPYSTVEVIATGGRLSVVITRSDGSLIITYPLTQSLEELSLELRIAEQELHNTCRQNENNPKRC